MNLNVDVFRKSLLLSLIRSLKCSLKEEKGAFIDELFIYPLSFLLCLQIFYNFLIFWIILHYLKSM